MANYLNEYDAKYTHRFRHARKSELNAADGELTPEEFAFALARLKINHVQFCEWLGLNPKQGRRYASGLIKVPKAVGKLLILMVRLDLTPEQV